MGCLSKGSVLNKAAENSPCTSLAMQVSVVGINALKVELLGQMVLTTAVYETADGLPDKMFYLQPVLNSSHRPLPALSALGGVRILHCHSHEQTSLLLNKDQGHFGRLQAG